MAASLALLLLPGVAVAYLIRVRGVALIALAGPLSIALVGTAGAVGDKLGVPYGWWSVVGLTAVACAIAAVVSRFVSPPSWARRAPGDALWAVAGIALVTIVFGIIAFRTAPIDAVSQTYDGVFHLNAAASIVDTGRASSFDLYRLTNPSVGNVEFYPAAWHSLVALTAELTGASVVTASGATWLASSAAVWTPGILLLTRTFAGRRATRGPLLLVPAALSTCFAGFPYLLLSWGTLYPTGLATTLLPSGLALLALLVPRSRAAYANGFFRGLRGSWWTLAAFAAWGVAEVFAHPRTLISLGILAFPLAVQAIVVAASGLRRHGRRRAALLVVAAPVAVALIAVAAVVITLFRDYKLGSEPISQRLTGGPARAMQTVWDGAVQVFTAAPVSAPGDVALPGSLLLAAAVLLGLFAASTTRRGRPLVAAFLLAGLLYCVAAGSDADLAKIMTGAWYKDKYRLVSLLPLLSIPLIGIGAVALRARLKGSRTVRRVVVGVLAAAVVLSSWFGPTLAEMSAQIGRTFVLPQSEKGGALVDADEVALLESLPDHVPADERVLGDPWNGSTLSWALGSREAVFPHLIGVWGGPRDVVATRLDQIRTDPEVCRSLDTLRVRYVVGDPEKLWGGNAQADFYSSIDHAIEAGLFTEVTRVGSSALYRIDECGPLPPA